MCVYHIDNIPLDVRGKKDFYVNWTVIVSRFIVKIVHDVTLVLVPFYCFIIHTRNIVSDSKSQPPDPWRRDGLGTG